MPVINPGETVAERNQRLGFGTIAPKDTNLVYTSGEKSPTPGQEQILGPYTPPAPSPTENPDPTIGDVYSGYVPGENTELNDAESAYLKMLKEQSQPVDEDAIRRKTQEQFQAEIDAVNRLFAEKKAEEARVGQGRIGSGTAVQARRGLLGSTFGEAQKERVVSYNQSIQDAIQAEQQLQLASIMNEVRQSAKEEAAAKTLARQQGAVAYVEFLRGQADRKQQRVSDAITNVLNSDTEVSEDLFASLAKELGVSVDIIKSQYNAAKKAATPEPTPADKPFSVAPGASVYDPTTGTFVTAPDRPADPSKPVTEKVGNTVYQYDPASNSWSPVVVGTDTTSQPASVQEYQFAVSQGYTGSLLDYQKAKAGTKPPTQPEFLAAGYANRIKQSIDNMKAVQDRVVPLLTSKYSLARNLPDRLKNGDVKAQIQAEENFINTILRRESGAAISDAEYQRAATQYFPQAGDTPQVLAQKAQNREAQLNTLIQSAGSAYEPASILDTGNAVDEVAVSQLIEELGISRQEALDALGFNQPLSMGVNGSTDVSGIKDYAKVSTAIGRGTATGIVAGSPLWKWGYDLVLEGGKGARVKSPVSGTIVKSGVDGGFGKRVGVKDAQGRVWYFGHLNDTNVKEGQQVNALADLGGQGNTGKTLGKSGIHVDITVKKPGGGYYTSQEVASLLNTKLA